MCRDFSLRHRQPTKGWHVCLHHHFLKTKSLYYRERDKQRTMFSVLHCSEDLLGFPTSCTSAPSEARPGCRKTWVAILCILLLTLGSTTFLESRDIPKAAVFMTPGPGPVWCTQGTPNVCQMPPESFQALLITVRAFKALCLKLIIPASLGSTLAAGTMKPLHES